MADKSKIPVIVGGVRTPIGRFLGGMASISAPNLGAIAIGSALERSGIDLAAIDEVIMGNVVTAGEGQAPARQAAINAGIPATVPSLTINKVCGSGMKTILMGAQTIGMGDADIFVAGGMENMSLAPHILPNSRSGIRFGNYEMKDAMAWDGLQDVYTDRPMGNCAEECASKYGFSREEQDSYAIESFKRAQAAIEQGIFKNEIIYFPNS